MTSEIHYATGRRKTSSARIYLSTGKGDITVNDKKLDVYFGRKVAQMLVMQPLEMTDLEGKLEELRPQLKKAGLLTRDPRKVERKKPGLVKARKSKQFSKR